MKNFWKKVWEWMKQIGADLIGRGLNYKLIKVSDMETLASLGFNAVDLNNDGYITIQEMIDTLKKLKK